ncbi:hypothetical protein MBLNU459_g2101t1 [Dothideomycetes sp. NU459]
MSGPGVGFEYPPVPVSWHKRDVLLFANSIGCTVDELHFLYELHPNFSVFPTYSILLPFKGTTPEVIDFYAAQNSKRAAIPDVPKFDSRRVVHGEQSISFSKPLPTSSEGKEFELRAKVIGVYDKGKPGSVVETEHLLVDKSSGDVYSRAVGSSFFVGQGNWNGPKGKQADTRKGEEKKKGEARKQGSPSLSVDERKSAQSLISFCSAIGPKTINYPPPEGKKPDAEHVHPTNAESAHLYRLNGDYNPLHATPEPGQAMGFGGAIMHGLYSWNTTCHVVLKLLGGSDPANIKEFAARFASPVKPGDALVTQIWRVGNADKDGFEDVRFVTSVKGGKVCLSNGRAKVRCVGQKSKL